MKALMLSIIFLLCHYTHTALQIDIHFVLNNSAIDLDVYDSFEIHHNLDKYRQTHELYCGHSISLYIKDFIYQDERTLILLCQLYDYDILVESWDFIVPLDGPQVILDLSDVYHDAVYQDMFIAGQARLIN